MSYALKPHERYIAASQQISKGFHKCPCGQKSFRRYKGIACCVSCFEIETKWEEEEEKRRLKKYRWDQEKHKYSLNEL